MKSKRSTYKRSSNAPILVLNSDYLPINITDFRKAFNLVYKGKAEVIVDANEVINTMSKQFKKPSVIRLTYHVNVPYRKVVLSKENIFRRDKHQCAYCDSRYHLTIDHVQPKSRGGRDTWENLVAACMRCNSRKGDRTPEEAGMKLAYQPFRPSPLHFMCESNKFREGWETYLGF
jgi:5-methylcytosine-specific restriction endonuclease McrA